MLNSLQCTVKFYQLSVTSHNFLMRSELKYCSGCVPKLRRFCHFSQFSTYSCLPWLLFWLGPYGLMCCDCITVLRVAFCGTKASPMNMLLFFFLKTSLFLRLKWREGKKCCQMQLRQSHPFYMWQQEKKTVTHDKHFRIDTLVIQRVSRDHVNLTIIHELRKLQQKFTK